jgi:hypothetical protein
MLSWWWVHWQRCWRFDGSWFECVGIEHAHREPEPAGPPPLDACWARITDTHTEAEYRYTLGMRGTLEEHRNQLYDVLWDMVRYHGYTPESIENELRSRKLDYVWLYAVAHDPDGAVTVCRDPLTRETRSHSIAVLLGTGSEAAVVRAGCRGALSECGFLEMK